MFNLGFFGKNPPKWWVGQVPSGQTDNKLDPKKWGDRVKVRIMGYHPAGPLLPDSDLPWALVLKPTSQGNGNKGSTGVVGGEWVMGFFLDDDCQLPIITGVLGRSNSNVDISANQQQSQGTTYFQNVNIFTSRNPASGWNYKSGDTGTPNGQKQPISPSQSFYNSAVSSL